MATTEDTTIGVLGIDIVANLEKFERDAGQRLKGIAEPIGNRTGRLLGQSLGRGIAEGMRRTGAAAATAGADQILQAATRRFERARGDAAEAFARKLIDRRALEQAGRDAADAFDAEVLKGIENLAKRGKLDDAAFIKLSGGLKNAGAKGREGFEGEMGRLDRFLRVGFTAGVLGTFALLGSRIVGLFRGLATTVQGLIARAGDIQSIRESFGALAAARGLDAGRAIEELRRGTRGLVLDFDLLRQANFALQAQLPLTEEGLGRLADVSRRLARATGRDATEAFQRLVNGIAKGEQNVLEELGLMTRLTDVLKAWEKQTGKNSDALSQQQKILLFYNAVMAEAERKVRDLGKETLTAGERLQQAQTFVSNLADAVTLAVVQTPQLVQLLDAVGSSAESSARRIENLADEIGATIDVMAEFIRAGARLAEVGTRPFRFIFGRIAIPKVEDVEALAGGLGSREEFLEQRRADRARQRRLEEIRGIKTVEEARARLLANLKEYDAALAREAVDAKETNRILEERAEIHRRLRKLQEPERAPGDEEDLAAAKKAAEERKRIEEQVADTIARIHLDTTDLALRETDKLQAAYRKAGGNIKGQFAKDLDEIRRNIEQQGQLAQQQADFATLAGLAPSPEMIGGMERMLDAAQAFRDTVKEGTPLWEQTLVFIRQIERTLEGLQVTKLTAGIAEEFARVTDEINLKLARGLITPEAAKRAARNAGEAFNEQLLAIIQELEDSGELSESLKRALIGQLKPADFVDPIVRGLREALERRQDELALAFRLEDIDEETFTRQGRAAFDAFIRAAVARARELAKQGRNDLADAILQMLPTAPPPPPETPEQRAKREIEERKRELREQARALEENVRAALQLAEAFGLISSEAAKSLQSVAQLAGALTRIAGSLKGGFSFKTFDFSAVGLALGAVATLGQSLFGGDPEAKHIQEANTRALDRLNQRLQDLTGLLSITGEQFSGAFVAASRALDFRDPSVRRRVGDIMSPDLRIRERFERELAAFGLTFEDAQRIARSFGIELDGTRESLEKFKEALKNTLTSEVFQSTARGRQRVMEREEEVFDIEDNTEKLERRRAFLLRELNLPEEEEECVRGLDLSTPEGRAVYQEWLLGLWKRLTSGDLTFRELGTLTPDQLDELIGVSEGILDELKDQGAAEGPESVGFQFRREVTELTATRLVGVLTTIDARMEMLVELATLANRYHADLLKAITGGALPTLPVPAAQVPPPPTSDVAGGRGPLTVSINIERVVMPDTNPDTVRRVAGELVDEMVDQLLEDRVDVALGHRTRRQLHVRGRL
jgi:hypothetical protein